MQVEKGQRERERQREGGRERERERENIPSRLFAASTETDVGLESLKL